MATYKVIQDIEADDKLLGPLTLRQFVYAGITVFLLYVCFFLASNGAAFMIALVLPFILLCGFFAVPWSKEQPTELWALARISFLIKPRKRIWDQSGLRELVTITAPKRIERIYSDGLSQTEVKSRLRALAETIDSRGWAIKNADMNPYINQLVADTGQSDRLIDMGSVPQDVPTIANDVVEDMYDPDTGAKAQQFDSMLNANAQAHRQHLIESMQQPAAAQPQQAQPAADYWFLNQQSDANVPKGNDMFGSQVVTPGADDQADSPVSPEEEKALTEELKAKAAIAPMQHSHLPTILPLAEQQKRAAEQQAAQNNVAAADTEKTDEKQAAPAVTAPPDTAILELAHNDDLNIATIARQAKKAHEEEANEVVISLR